MIIPSFHLSISPSLPHHQSYPMLPLTLTSTSASTSAFTSASTSTPTSSALLQPECEKSSETKLHILPCTSRAEPREVNTKRQFLRSASKRQRDLCRLSAVYLHRDIAKQITQTTKDLPPSVVILTLPSNAVRLASFGLLLSKRETKGQTIVGTRGHESAVVRVSHQH